MFLFLFLLSCFFFSVVVIEDPFSKSDRTGLDCEFDRKLINSRSFDAFKFFLFFCFCTNSRSFRSRRYFYQRQMGNRNIFHDEFAPRIFPLLLFSPFARLREREREIHPRGSRASVISRENILCASRFSLCAPLNLAN